MLKSLFSKLFKKAEHTESVEEVNPHQQPLLDEAAGEMKRVYWLSEELELDPSRVSLTHALTQDRSRPNMGLNGRYGLFATREWWNNINQEKMPLKFVSGTIIEAYEAGQDICGLNNTVDLKLKDGTIESVGIYANNDQDIELFSPGSKVEMVYALDELKQQPGVGGDIAYSKVALEVVVSINEGY